MVQKYSEKETSPNKEKGEKKKKHVWLSGRLHIEGRLNEGPRLQRKHKNERKRKRKRSKTKTNVTPSEKDVMASADQTPGGYKFASFVASQQGRANQHEPACFGLSSSWSFPSRSGIPECFNDWGGRGYDDSFTGEVTKTTPSGDRIT